MKLLILGASGSTGRKLVEHGLEAGHEITAFVRRPEAVELTHPRLRIAQGDVRRKETLESASAGQDAVLSAIGPAAGAPAGDLISVGVRNALEAMRQNGVRRFVFESGLMLGGEGLARPKRWALALYRRLNRALYEDKVIAEQAIRASGLEWVIVRPPTLHHKPPRGRYEVGENLDVALSRGLSHGEVAEFMIQAVSDPRYLGRVLEIGYRA